MTTRGSEQNSPAPKRSSKTSRTFVLFRTEDVSGISGTGVVAEGIEFEDGQVVMSWMTRHHSLEIYPNIKEILNVHGHDGKTSIVWDEKELSK